MRFQTQQPAKFLRPFRQPILLNAHQRCRVVRHDGHAHVHHRPSMTFVSDVGGPSTQQVLNKTFDHRSAVSTGAGQVDLVGGTLSVQARLMQHLADLLLRGRRRERCDRPRNAHRQNASGMEGLPQRCIIEGEVTGQGVDDRLALCSDPGDGVLHFVDQGQHITLIAGIADGEMEGEREARGHIGENAGFFAKLGGTVALTFQNWRNGEVIRVDEFALRQRLASREASGLFFDVLMGLYSRRKLGVQARALVLRKLPGAAQALLGCPSQRQDLLSHLKYVLFGLAHQRHKHFPFASALPAKAPHELLEVMLELASLPLQGRCPFGGLGGNVRDDLEDFFLARYNVAASLTRWLPCSLGNVSITTWAGLTNPASMAVAAWMVSNSSIRASSIRQRNWARTSGSTKCPCERSACTSIIPQAYITAKSVRNRLQICSSEQDN